MMRYLSIGLVLGCFLTGSSTTGLAFYLGSGYLDAGVAPLARISADCLRSAHYLRDSGRDHLTRYATPRERSDELRRHFGAVLAILIANNDRSLDIATERLEQVRDEAWTLNERTAWRQMLAQRRLLNLGHLLDYQLRGRFPKNEHVERIVPVFVDDYGTTCAVAHLMCESGWSEAVAAIRRGNNLVYVADVREGPIADWVLVSGLTHEEVALIQPAYGPQYLPPPFDAGLDALTQGGSISKNELRIDNFRFLAGGLAVPDSFPEVSPTNQIELAQFGGTIRNGSFQAIDPVFDDWLFVGARSMASLVHDPDQPWGVVYSYVVTVADPDARLAAASLESFPGNFNFAGGGALDVQSWVYPGENSGLPALAHLTFDGDSERWIAEQDSARFPPQQKLTIVTAVEVPNSSVFTSMIHSFQVVPEPATGSLVALGSILSLTFVRRRGCCPTLPRSSRYPASRSNPLRVRGDIDR